MDIAGVSSGSNATQDSSTAPTPASGSVGTPFVPIDPTDIRSLLAAQVTLDKLRVSVGTQVAVVKATTDLALQVAANIAPSKA